MGLAARNTSSKQIFLSVSVQHRFQHIAHRTDNMHIQAAREGGEMLAVAFYGRILHGKNKQVIVRQAIKI